MFSNSEGLAIGCGERYGLFIKGDLLSGNCYKCDTFDNELLSKENDFNIQFLEVLKKL